MNTNDRFLKEFIWDLEQAEKEEKIENKKKEREEKKKEQLENRIKKKEDNRKKQLVNKRNRSTKGILQVGCGNIIPYQYKFKLNDKVIYVNICLAGGQRVNELMGYLCGSSYSSRNTYEDIDGFITSWCNFKYKLFNYDDYYYVMYIYNQMYDIDFSELVLNNEVSLKDVINTNNSDNNKTNEDKYADLD